jgi:hypothetical protein
MRDFNREGGIGALFLRRDPGVRTGGDARPDGSSWRLRRDGERLYGDLEDPRRTAHARAQLW